MPVRSRIDVLQVGDDYPADALADLRTLTRQSRAVVLVKRDSLANMAARSAAAAGLPCANGATVLWMPNGDALVIGNVDAV